MSKSFKNIVVVAGSTMGSRVLGLCRDVMMFAYFGATGLSSAFIFAFTLPNLFRRLLGEGALTSAFVPVMSHEVEEKGNAQGFQFLNEVISWVGLVLTGLVLIGMGAMWFGGDITGLPERWYMGFEFGVVLLPYMVMVCLAAVLNVALNVVGRFGLSAMSQVWLNLAMIGAMVWGASVMGPATKGHVYMLCGGILFGGMLQVLIPAVGLMRWGWSPRVSFGRSAAMRELWMLLLPGLASAAIFQVNIVISRLLAFSLNDQAVSILYLANRLLELPIGVFTIAVTTVLFPSISRLVASANWAEVKGEYAKGLRGIFAITVPAMVGLIVLNEPILRVLFEWGKFGVSDVKLTQPILMVFALGLPFYSLATFATRGFHAMKDMKTPYRVSIWAMVSNVVLSLVFMKIWGMVGLAVANVLVVIFQSMVLQRLLVRKEEAFRTVGLGKELAKIILASAVMGVGVYLLNGYMGEGKLEAAIVVGAGIPLAVGVYGALLYFSGMRVRTMLRRPGRCPEPARDESHKR